MDLGNMNLMREGGRGDGGKMGEGEREKGRESEDGKGFVSAQ